MPEYKEYAPQKKLVYHQYTQSMPFLSCQYIVHRPSNILCIVLLKVAGAFCRPKMHSRKSVFAVWRTERRLILVFILDGYLIESL